MDHHVKVQEAFEVVATRKEFFTAGKVKVSKNGSKLFCQCLNHVTVVNVNDSSIEYTIPPGLEEFNSHNEEDINDRILIFSLSNDEDIMATAHQSGLIKIWKWQSSELVTTWKSGHKGHIFNLAFNNVGTHLVSGSSDSILRVWNIDNHTCEHKLGGLTGITSILQYQFVNEKEILFASGDETSIRGWYLEENKAPNLLYNFSGHFSRITKLLFSDKYMISCCRDKSVMLWDLETRQRLITIPMFESIESSTLLPECISLPGFEKPIKGLLCAFGGESGKIHIYNLHPSSSSFDKALFIHKFNNECSPILHLDYNISLQALVSVRRNHSITIFNLDHKFSIRKQLVGNLDEITDMVYFGVDEKYLAVATNSCDIYVFDSDMNCSIVGGHSDLVISLATHPSLPNIIVSGSKDNSIKVWMLNDGIINCVASGSRHTASVGAVALSSTQNSFIVSGSEDKTIKMWNLPPLRYKTSTSLTVSKTLVAHDKPINSICISLNDMFVATGSEDKTAKIWSTSDLSLLGVLRGHRRAVWTVKFSPIDQVLLTSSADSTLRLWSLTNFSCLKTLEGQDCSVLNSVFINNGTQILSSGTDGVIKVWLIKSGEIISSLEKHCSRVLAIAVKRDESCIVTGGSDSRILFWNDKTTEKKVAEITANQEKVGQEQHLSNLLKANNLLRALQYAISLDRPFNVLKIIEGILEQKLENEGLQDNREKLRSVINNLGADHKEALLGYVVHWNSNGKKCFIAQLILSFLIDEVTTKKLRMSNENLQGLIAYSNRHYDRMMTHFESIQIIPYTLNLMKPGYGKNKNVK